MERERERGRERASAREGHRKVALMSLLNAQKAMSTPRYNDLRDCSNPSKCLCHTWVQGCVTLFLIKDFL